MKRLRVLVLCTGNSCRSVMAEALINQLGQGRFEAVSAGSSPAGYVQPETLSTLQRHGIDPGSPRSKSWDEFADRPFDLVITVCDQAAEESCPVFSGGFRKLHWSTPDPAAVKGDHNAVAAAFDATFDSIRKRVTEELL